MRRFCNDVLQRVPLCVFVLDNETDSKSKSKMRCHISSHGPRDDVARPRLQGQIDRMLPYFGRLLFPAI